jgi:hypothetical protein
MASLRIKRGMLVGSLARKEGSRIKYKVERTKDLISSRIIYGKKEVCHERTASPSYGVI